MTIEPIYSMIKVRLNFKIIFFILCLNFYSSVDAQNIPNKSEDISPLLIGESLPKATLRDSNGDINQLSEIISKKPSLLVFYRGGWCPYCNLQLSGLGKIEQDILDLGYQIVAISPDDYRNLKNTEEKDGVKYQLFSDPEGKLIRDIGIAYKTPLVVKGYLSIKKEQEGKTANILPVPAVFITNQKGEIIFEYINPDYKVRLSEKMLLAVLKSLKEEN